MEAEAKLFRWLEKKNAIETNVKDCTACLTSGKIQNNKNQKKHYGKTEKLTEPAQEIQIDFTRKLHKKSIHGGVQILIAIDIITNRKNL